MAGITIIETQAGTAGETVADWDSTANAGQGEHNSPGDRRSNGGIGYYQCSVDNDLYPAVTTYDSGTTYNTGDVVVFTTTGVGQPRCYASVHDNNINDPNDSVSWYGPYTRYAAPTDPTYWAVSSQTPPPADEIQSITIDATGGTFAVSGDGGSTYSLPLTFDTSALLLQAALDLYYGSGNSSVTGGNGGPFTVEWIGTLADQPVALIVGDGSNLTTAGVTNVSIDAATVDWTFESAVATVAVQHQVVISANTVDWTFDAPQAVVAAQGGRRPQIAGGCCGRFIT